MRIGVLGCGQWGRNHARTLARMGVLAAVADGNPENAGTVAAQNHVPALSVDRLLRDPSIDGLVIALPPSLHAAHALAAIDEGKHVLVEKPMALDLDDAARLTDRAQEKGVIGMTGHVLRFHPAVEALEALAREGSLGALRHIDTMRVGLGRSHPGSDGVLDLLPHDLSVILALTAVSPGLPLLARGHLAPERGEDPAELRLSFTGGLTAISRVSNQSTLRERRMAIRFARGLAVFDDLQPWPRKLAILDQGAADPRYLSLPEREPLAEELRHFVDGIGGAPVTRSTFEEGLKVLRLIAICGRRQGRGLAAPPPVPSVEHRAR